LAGIGTTGKTVGETCVDRTHDCAWIAVDVFEPAEGERGQVRSCPGSKILGGELLTGDLAQICIDLA